jgi:alanine racemase
MNEAHHESAQLTVRLGAIAENYRTCRSLAGHAAVSGVVKADAYGLGMAEVARKLLMERCDTFFVARLEEGIALRPVASAARIFVLDGVRAESVAAYIASRLTPVLNSLDEISLWAQNARGRDAAIHIDTGMCRLGLPQSELALLAAEAGQRLSSLNLVLIASHLACADDPDSPMSKAQLDRFRAALAALPSAPASFASSGGILLGCDYTFDLVRPGIGLYGGNPQSGRPNPFKTAARLTAPVLQVRRVDKGESVGYGATFGVGRPTTLATVALGYADGLKRALGNRGMGAIGGLKAPIVGRVSMDLVTLDVTDVPPEHVFVGAQAEFLGDAVLLDDVAAAAGTANYDILTSIGPRVGRIYEPAA